LIVLLVSLKNVWLVITLFSIALFNEQLALAFIYFSGGHVDSVQLLVANLAFVLTISAGLHYLGYFREAHRDGLGSPAWKAIRQAFIPSMLAAMTTSFGFVSLCVSEIVPIRSFGFYSAILVPVNSIIVISLLAIHVTWTTRRSWRLQLVNANPTTLETSPNTPTVRDSRLWSDSLLKFLGLRPLFLLFIWLLVIFITGVGVTRLQTSVGTHKLLSPGSKLITDYAWLEKNVGALVPIELVLQFPSFDENDPFEFLNRLRAIDHLRKQIETLSDIESTWSVLNFLPPLPADGGIKNTAKKAMIGKMAMESKSQFIEIEPVLSYLNGYEVASTILGDSSVKYGCSDFRESRLAESASPNPLTDCRVTFLLISIIAVGKLRAMSNSSVRRTLSS
jgi:predicted RND superfamily exporter protein